MRILIAEDEPTSRRMLELVLRKWGYTVIPTCDGKEAWQVLQCQNPPRLAILDWMMPELDGVEVCRKSQETDSPTPPYIILLTAKGQTEDTVAGLEAGASDYVTKPFNPAELRARVRVGERVLDLQSALSQRVKELQEAIDHVTFLQGLLPICMYCHKIRDDRDTWQRLEDYIEKHSGAQFSHGLCPECEIKYYSDSASKAADAKKA